MISIVIPTLWKAKEIYETIISFKKYNTIGAELIIIDNANSSFQDPSLTVVKPKTNIGVNPAWNVGSILAQNEHILFLNDDITINFKLFFEFIKTLNTLDYGLITLDKTLLATSDINNDEDILEIEKCEAKFNGFGCFMIIKKKLYPMVPQEFKIFYGDFYFHLIFENILRLPILYIKGLKTKGRISVTSSEIKTHDEDQYWDGAVNKARKFYEPLTNN
jgi:glycosyltransferase involved in cell wall biosynthesis